MFYNLIVEYTDIYNVENFIALMDNYTAYECMLEEENRITVSYNDDIQSKEVLEEIIISNKLCDEYKLIDVKNENWNQVFESSFNPILSKDNFWGIRASFHPSLDVKNEIVIDPKMSFGTGHHETTYQMMEMMRNLDHKNKTIWDYGSGTGVLGIFSSILGASSIILNDVEEGAYRNSIENIKINKTDNIKSYQGKIEDIEAKKILTHSTKFNIILANITKNILLNSALKIGDYSKSKTDLLLSGFFESDIEEIIEIYEQHDFKIINQSSKNNWACLHLKKES